VSEQGIDPELEEWANAMREWAVGATVDEALGYSRSLVDRVLAEHSLDREITAVVGLLSGGNDSTTFCHAFRDQLTHLGHANTGIGVEETREHVRRIAAAWELPLIEESPPPGATYEELVLRFGFPGPGSHGLMVSRLKERAFRQIRRRFVEDHRRQRIVFLAGMRHFESTRRMANTEETHREGSIVWISPFAWWTDDHLNEYRSRHDVPRNEVSDHLHMSGECLCGAFAKPGELEQLRFFYPDAAAAIDGLAARAKVAQKHCVWGTRPPRKPKGATGPTWLCFHDGAPHDNSSSDSCDDGTWWAPSAAKAPVLETGPICQKCEATAEEIGEAEVVR